MNHPTSDLLEHHHVAARHAVRPVTLGRVVGLLGLLFVAPWCARGWAALDVAIARGLLGRPVEEAIEELEERVDTLQASRTWAVEIAEAERRRIERDLHDGAQQRLVALAMDLGMAREKLDSDPDAAKRAIPRAVIDGGYVLIGCEPARSRLEDIFMESVADDAL